MIGICLKTPFIQNITVFFSKNKLVAESDYKQQKYLYTGSVKLC